MYIDDVPTPPVAGPSQPRDTDESVHGRCGDPGESSSVQGGPSNLENLAERVHRVESSLSQIKTALAQPNRPSATLESGNESDIDAMTAPSADKSWVPQLRGRGFATKFNGSTHTSVVLKQVPGLHQFTVEAFDKFPAMDQIRRAIHKSETWSDTARLGTPEKLRGLLPPRAETDALVDAYLENFELVYHILYLPGFRRDYDELWRTGSNQEQQFVAVVLLIVASALCLTSTGSKDIACERPSARDRATRIIQACENWFQSRPLRYNRLLDFQASFLLLLARQLNGRRYKQTWPNAGKLVRIFMGVGLHREGTNLTGEISSLDRELRRRIWAAAAEFELQASFEQGMAPISWVQQSDIHPPKNVPDDVFDGSVDSLKASHTLNPSWYLSVSTKSLYLRHSLTNVLNDIHAAVTFSDTKGFTEKIMAHLSAVPPCSTLKTKPISALLYINLQQYQLALHLRQTSLSDSPIERDFSLMIMWNTATEIIKIHRAVFDNGNNLLELLCGDQFRAALSICYVYITYHATKNVTSLSLAEHEFFLFMKDAVKLVQNKALRFSGDQRQLWIAVASHYFMKLFKEPHKREYFLKLAVEEFVAPFCNESNPSLEPADKTTISESTPATVAASMMPSLDDSTVGQTIFDDAVDWSCWEIGLLNTQDFTDTFFDFN